jgi:hypothetical protein|tara:strand:- start:681 stop:1058 length:378 start_codon:yes stop_codon:yes gene_type:complete
MDSNQILDIANEAYPKIIKHFGKGEQPIPKIKVFRNVFVDLTGDEDAEGEDKPSGRYDREANQISLYSDYVLSKEEILRNVVHEYTHYLLDGDESDELYAKGYTYQNHPHELTALRAEEKWHLFA